MVNLWEFNKGRYKVNNSFSQNIKMIRKDYGLTQEELGNKYPIMKEAFLIQNLTSFSNLQNILIFL